MHPQNSFLPTEDAARKALPIFTFLTQYFPAVWAELTKVCVAGNIQHNPELAPTDIKWSRGKSTDQMNTAFRHLFDRGQGLHFDADGQRHIIKAIWRLCAQAQLDIEVGRQESETEDALGVGEIEDGAATEHCFPLSEN